MADIKSITDKLNEGRQYRSFELSAFERRTLEDGQITVRGYASTFGEAYELWREPGFVVYERVLREAFDDCDMTDVIMQYDHRGRVFARTSNNTLRVEPDETGLHIDAYLGGTEIGRQLYSEIEGGYTTKMSYGYRLRDDGLLVEVSDQLDDGTTVVMQTVRGIAKLYDVSAVSLPANDMTSISARSAADGAIAAIKEERLAAKRRAEQIARIKLLTQI